MRSWLFCSAAFFALWSGAALAAGDAPTAADSAGGRDFPEGITIDEPGIDDVMMLPQIVTLDHGADDGDPAFNETDVNFAFEKRLTDQVGFTIGDGYTSFTAPHTKATTGWQNVTLNLKYNFLEDDAHEWVASAAVTRVFGASGASAIGAGPHGSTTPAFDIGKGMGDASDRWFRPFAVTLNLDETFPDAPSRQTPYLSTIGGSLQYDLAYLEPEGDEVGRAHLLGRFTPIVEAVYTGATSLADGVASVGTASPGLVYKTDAIQVAAVALVPLTKATGRHVGGILQLNIFFSGRMGEPVF